MKQKEHPLRKLRRTRGYSLQTVADATGLDITWLSRVERGVIANPAHGKVVRLASFFNVETAVIFPVAA